MDNHNEIPVLVWDDSPPGAPVYIESDIPEGLDKQKVITWLGETAIQGRYDIDWKMAEIGPPTEEPKKDLRFHVKHPTMQGYDDAKDQPDHQKFLDELVGFFSRHEYEHDGKVYPLRVYSES